MKSPESGLSPFPVPAGARHVSLLIQLVDEQDQRGQVPHPDVLLVAHC